MQEGERHRAYLSLGSNLGDRAGAIGNALGMIARLEGTEVTAVSSIYETEPVGFTEQPEFLNCAAAIDTTMTPTALLASLNDIERTLGRTRREKWHEREIDIDIVFYDDLTIATPTLTIPHPEMHRRGFVLAPLAEIAPDLPHPLLGRSVAGLLADSAEGPRVRRLQTTPPLYSTGHDRTT